MLNQKTTLVAKSKQNQGKLLALLPLSYCYLIEDVYENATTDYRAPSQSCHAGSS